MIHPHTHAHTLVHTLINLQANVIRTKIHKLVESDRGARGGVKGQSDIDVLLPRVCGFGGISLSAVQLEIIVVQSPCAHSMPGIV